MPPADNSAQASVATMVMGRLLLAAFGLGSLAFLIAIDRPQWFHIHPANGVAAAPPHAARPL
ncbi:hypothetical protein [Sphingomonas abietis]|uniref:Uncharacterized protein n=1 Tax=Sphingomonas abietis TaxID=3012344 RepID=A0ABY7NS76_9SPHN|nr:hypothetical protein [Sphingomonas abietis]WBO22814.1 hypothetical protein PBT88_01280 [Sphingomonas abietis]